MKILHLTRHLEIGGIPRYVLDLTIQHQARGHQITVAAMGGAKVPALEASGARHVEIPLSSKFEFGPKLWLSWKALLPVLRKNHFDIVHAHTRIAQLLAHLIERHHGIPAVTTCHGFFRPNLGRHLWPCWGRKVIAISAVVAQHLKTVHGVPRENIVCVPSGIDATPFLRQFSQEQIFSLRAQLGIGRHAQVVGTVARLSAGKGLNHLLGAVALLVARNPQAHCLIVGDGNERKRLESLAGTLKITKHVTFAGAAQDVAPYLAMMDVFILPSLTEGLGLAILEAFAAGKPVVASRAGGIINVVEDGKNGVLVRPGDERSIAQAVERLLSDRAWAQTLAQAGRKTVQEKFLLSRMAQEIENVYAGLLAPSQGT